MKRSHNDPLTPAQKKLVKAFILQNLKPTKSKRKGRNNELYTIGSALDKWFKRYYGFNIGLSATGELFEELEGQGYYMIPMGEEYDPETKIARPCPLNGESRTEEPYMKRSAMLIYVNLDPTRIKLLRKACTTLPLNTSAINLLELTAMEWELQDFQIKNFFIAPWQ